MNPVPARCEGIMEMMSADIAGWIFVPVISRFTVTRHIRIDKRGADFPDNEL
jgi:hypothetical protein